MAKIAVFISFLMIFFSCSAGVRAEEISRISEAEVDYLARAIAVSYPEVSFGGRVAIAAVVLNRMGAVGFPDSAGGAVMSLASEWEFSGVYKVAGEVGEKLLRLSSDAVEAAINGADPTGGALFFESISGIKRSPDLDFNDVSEDESRREMQDYFIKKYGVSAVIIDEIGFWVGY